MLRRMVMLMLCLPLLSFAEDVFKGNWKQFYLLSDRQGKTIELSHTPDVISFGYFFNVYPELSMVDTDMNGIQIKNLYLHVDSTMEEFEYNISKSSLSIVKKSSTLYGIRESS